MDTAEEIRVRQIRRIIFANEPDREHEFKLSEESYNQLRTEFVKDEDDNAYPRLLYDWTRQVITIVTAPTDLHEDTSTAILSSIYDRVTSIMQREQIELGSDETLATIHSPTILVDTGHSRYEMESDGAIYFETVDARDYKIIIEVGVSQAYNSLFDKARKWIIDNTCDLVILLAFNEKYRYSAPRQRIFLSPHESKAQIVQMRRHLRSPSYPKFRKLEFLGHFWFHELSDAFIEVVRKAPSFDGTDDLMRSKYVLVENGINKSSSVPRSIGNIFFDSVTFLDIIWRAMIANAVNRFKRAVKVRS
ncbi:hypothetical protein V1519DRAFT_479415 [Lipomyces tetrasporus]